MRTSHCSARRLVAPVAVLLAAVICLAGCGVQREEANRILKRADELQRVIESLLGGIESFPVEWRKIFAAGATADALGKANALVASKLSDVERVVGLTKQMKKELEKMSRLNVDASIKEYAKLRISALDALEKYADGELWEIFKGYEGMLASLQHGAGADELNSRAAEIIEVAGRAAEKLDEFRGAVKQADDFFDEYARGNKQERLLA